MRMPPVLAGVAAGAALAVGGAAAIDFVTAGAEAQSGDPVTQADLSATNQRSQAAINGYKNLSNRFGKYLNDPGQLIGANSGPIRQDRGVGGGLPTEAVADGAITSAKLASGVLAQAGAAGTTGPQGPTGATGPAGSAAAYAQINGASGTIDPAESSNVTAANLAKVGTGLYCLGGLPFTPKSALAVQDPEGLLPILDQPSVAAGVGTNTLCTAAGVAAPHVIVYLLTDTSVGVDSIVNVWIED